MFREEPKASVAPEVCSKGSREGHVDGEAGPLEPFKDIKFYYECGGDLLESSEQRSDVNRPTFYGDSSGF